MMFKAPYVFYFFTTIVLLFVRSSIADDEVLQYMDQSVDPCTDFYEFACGRYMKNVKIVDESSPSKNLYVKMIMNILTALKSDQTRSGLDVSVARNIYKNCKKFDLDETSKQAIVEYLARLIGLYDDNFDWIDVVHKMRKLGLNFRYLLGLYVSPRSRTDKRNILEIRHPFLTSDVPKHFSSKKRELKILNARKFIKSLNGLFPMKRYIEGLLPKDSKFSWDDEIRVDVAYIQQFLSDYRKIDETTMREEIEEKISTEVGMMFLQDVPSYDTERINNCYEKAIFYDYSFQVASTKRFLSEEEKDFITDVSKKILKTTKKLLTQSPNADHASLLKTMERLSDLQVMIGYSNNTIEEPKLNWKNVNRLKYVLNILKLSKYQMDSKFRQLNVVNDVREWDARMIPTTLNAGYHPKSNSIYVPAIYISARKHHLQTPKYIPFASFGSTFGHELGHLIDRFVKKIARSNVEECKDCLRDATFELTGEEKEYEEEDFADLTGLKIAYYSFLESAEENGYDQPWPGSDYNSRQMFWIRAASERCSKHAYKSPSDKKHSPNYARVIVPFSNLPEFARDFNCPIGSPMNPETKCTFL